MKTILLLFSILTTCMLSAQDKTEQYYVIKVQGEIQRLKTGNLLNTGDEFNSSEGLNFRTDYSRAAVISPIKGRFILTAQSKSDNGSKANFLPPMNNLSSRATVISTTNDVFEYFSGEVLFLETDSLKYDNSKLELDQNNYFYVTYDSSGIEKQNVIEASNGLICVNKSTFFKNGQPKTAKIVFHSALKNNQLNEFSPIFPDQEKLISEVKLLISNSNGKPRTEVLTDVTSYLNDFYGKVTKSSVNNWLQQSINF
jgi:hypothetical protein